MDHPLSLPVKVGVVGCGGIAQIIHLPVLTQLKEVKVVAVCDIDIRKATVVANRFGVKRVYNDIEELITQNSLDAVFILTPNNMHLPMSLIALRNGVHVFIERPGARNSEEARRILAAAEKHQCHVMVGMHTRFRSDIHHIRNLLLKKTVGDIFFIKSEWLQAKFQAIKQPWLLSKNIAGGGVLLDLGIQLIDTSWWLTNKPELESIKAHSEQINSDLEVEDFCSFYLEFSNNLKLACHISWNFPINKDRFSAEIFGSTGSISLNPFKVEKVWQGKTMDLTPKDYNRRHSHNIFKMAYETEIYHFINFLTGEEENLESDISELLQVLEMTDAIYESLNAGREIILKKKNQ